MKRNYLTAALSSLLMVAVLFPAGAVQSASEKAGKADMLERYERAQYLWRGEYSQQVVFNGRQHPYWIDDSDSFWYIRETLDTSKTGKTILKDGYDTIRQEIRLVDAKKQSNIVAFNHDKLAKSLSEATGKKLDRRDMIFDMAQNIHGNIRNLKIFLKPLVLTFQFEGKAWRYEVKGNELTEARHIPHYESLSPDGTHVTFHKDYNVWVRDLKTGEERQLTTDGEDRNYYMPYVGNYFSKSVEGRWSPDGKYILTYQLDRRAIEDVWQVNLESTDGTLRPIAQKTKPFSGFHDSEILESSQFVAIEVATGKVVRADYSEMPGSNLPSRLFQYGQAWWGKDNGHAYFIDVDRYFKKARVVRFDTRTGATKILFEETSDTSLAFAQQGETKPILTPLPETDELLWYSERSGWGHLYLYDLKTGKLKNAVTNGDWLVRHVVRYDTKRREVFVQTGGRVKGRNPYYRDLVRVNIDTGKMVTVAASNHDVSSHAPRNILTYEEGGVDTNGVSPTGNYAVFTKSRVNTVPTSYLVDRNGKELMELEKADISRLPKNWQWPEPVHTIAADGKTDIYGVVFRPSNFDANKKYPVINYVMNSPLYTAVPTQAFNFHDSFFGYFTGAALAELGFIVVEFDGRGSPRRSKAFRDHSYGWMMGRASDLADHIAGIRQLAKRYNYIDVDRVGVYSGLADQGAVQGMLQYPDFYKVGVQGTYTDYRTNFYFNHDPSNGPEGSNPDRKFPAEMAGNLKGKLLLTIQTKSPFSPVPVVFDLAGALTAANKDYDLLFEPRAGWIGTSYLIRRGWDYLVRHLQGNTPPENFTLDGHLYFDPDSGSAWSEVMTLEASD